LLCASLTGLCFASFATRAEAAEARRRFDIPAKPYSEALIDLAVQANVSLLGASTCDGGQAPALFGRFTLSDALAKVLAGAPCAWRIVDAQTVRISPLPAQASPRQAAPAPPLVTELLVTARKRPERLDTLPAGVSVISGDQLRASGAGDARDTAGQLVGVLMTNLGPGRDKLLMRGLSDGAFTGRARSTVSTYLDDAPINYNAPDPDLRLTDVDQIETVRGPQGALYGSGALAGVYRIVTNKPDPEHFLAGGGAISATTKGGSPSYEADAFVNLPFGDGRAALRLVAYDDDKGGYLDNVALRLSNVDLTTRQGGRAALRIALGDNWTLDLAAAGQRLSSRDTQYTTLTASKTLRTNQVREASDNNFAQGAVTLHGELGWADLTSSTSYVQHAYSSLYDATAQASAFSETGAALGIYSESARIRRAVQDLVLTSSGAGQVSWLVGVYGSTSTERTPSSLDILAAPGVVTASAVKAALVRVYDEDRRDHLHEAAAYGETTWRFAPGWTAAAGARVFETSLRVKSRIGGAPPTAPRDVAVSRSFNSVTSKLSVQYELADGALIYGLYSDGFRPGGVNTTNFIGIIAQRTTFEPDRLRNFELGAKGRFLDRRLTLRAAAFYDVWANLQSDQYRSSGVAYTANVGDAHIQGLEAEAAYDWDFGLTVQANGLYSDAKITRINPDFFRNNPALAQRLGSGLPGAPKLSGGLLVRYERPLSGPFGLRLVGQANYVGPARLTFDPTLSDRTDAVVDTELLAEVTARRWSAGVFVNNLADSSSNTFAYGNPFTFGKVRQVTPQRPRTVGVRLAATF
jgi:outer membrane receptor protein involved in Fe transport